MKINVKLLSRNFNRGGNNPMFIVVHDTLNASIGADAEAHYKYFNKATTNASVHYMVDSTQVLQIVREGDGAGHVGKGKNGITNNNSIGIEMCINADGDFKVTLASTIELVKELMAKYNIPIERVVRHHDASSWGKICPRSLADNNWEEWFKFKEALVETPEAITPEWKLNGLKSLSEAGIITDFEGWAQKIDEPAPNWLVFELLDRIRKELNNG